MAVLRSVLICFFVPLVLFQLYLCFFKRTSDIFKKTLLFSLASFLKGTSDIHCWVLLGTTWCVLMHYILSALTERDNFGDVGL